MADRVYKAQIPALRKRLARLRENFSSLSSTTNWTRLRIDPLLKHVVRLEQLLESEELSSRLTKGVVFFHSDLVYLRTNVQGLERLLQSAKEILLRRDKKKTS
jgi:hypothetical protein